MHPHSGKESSSLKTLNSYIMKARLPIEANTSSTTSWPFLSGHEDSIIALHAYNQQNSKNQRSLISTRTSLQREKYNEIKNPSPLQPTSQSTNLPEPWIRGTTKAGWPNVIVKRGNEWECDSHTQLSSLHRNHSSDILDEETSLLQQLSMPTIFCLAAS